MAIRGMRDTSMSAHEMLGKVLVLSGNTIIKRTRKTWLARGWTIEDLAGWKMGRGGVGAGEGERCPCKVALMEWVPPHANPQNNAGGTSGFVCLIHCVLLG
jgi:hypothetical protein